MMRTTLLVAASLAATCSTREVHLYRACASPALYVARGLVAGGELSALRAMAAAASAEGHFSTIAPGQHFVATATAERALVAAASARARGGCRHAVRRLRSAGRSYLRKTRRDGQK